MIDIGVNFHSKQLVPHHHEILERARAAGVTAILATGTSPESSRLACDLSNRHEGFLFATAGCHPHVADHWTPAVLDALRALWARANVVAVGECGLDYNRNFSTPANQRLAFANQLTEAALIRKPLFLHCRDAFADFRAMMAEATAAGATGVAHCFTGSSKDALSLLELGLDIGVTGWVTDLKRGEELREAVRHIPLERLHLETDAPYLSPRNLKNRRPYNEPGNLPWVAMAIAEIKGIPVDTVKRQCTANSQRLFRLA